MRKWNKLLALVLAMVMVFGLTATAFAAEGDKSEDPKTEAAEPTEGEDKTDATEPAEGEDKDVPPSPPRVRTRTMPLSPPRVRTRTMPLSPPSPLSLPSPPL